MTRSFLRAGVVRLLLMGALVGLAAPMPGCTTVPPEAPELSYTVGQDLEALHGSYRNLIKMYFESLRQQVNDAIDRVYVPAFINEFVKTGKLVENAQQQRADLVEAWARIAVEKIDEQRKTRLAPLEQAENELLESVDQAFDRAIHANAVVTAHLNSIREVQEVQKKILEAFDLEDLRQQINDTLAKASDEAAKINSQVNAAADALKGQGQ